jgi:hypothetical protein
MRGSPSLDAVTKLKLLSATINTGLARAPMQKSKRIPGLKRRGSIGSAQLLAKQSTGLPNIL